MEGVVKPDFVRNSSADHFFCPRGGSGTEVGGRAAFRRRVAGDREMAPDTKLHPGQFAFALRPSERHASGTSFAFGSGKREFSWLRRAVERPFVRCSGNDSKVAFSPGKLKGVSSRKQSECCQNFGASIIRCLAQVSHRRSPFRAQLSHIGAVLPMVCDLLLFGVECIVHFSRTTFGGQTVESYLRVRFSDGARRWKGGETG